MASDPQWIALLHYRLKRSGRLQSEINSGKFFLAGEGRTDPAAELEATIRAVFRGNEFGLNDGSNPRCRFPLRFDWLAEELGLQNDGLKGCKRLIRWLGKPRSVDLVYADAFMGSPSSMFGHIFLRLNDARRDEDSRLIDSAINFAAHIEGMGPLEALARGISGGLVGKFSTKPYYLKVKEYGDMEARDLWEYRLSLTASQVRKMAMHVWEMSQAEFRYSFFNKNCAYQILPLINIANSTLKLRTPWRMGTIPVDVVRVLRDRVGFEKVRVRNSAATDLLRHQKKLDKEEIRLVSRLVRKGDATSREDFARLAKTRKPLVLDSALGLVQFLRGHRRNQWDLELAEAQEFLIGRKLQQENISEWSMSTTNKQSPDLGHGPSRFGTSLGWDENGVFGEYSFRPALHDVLGGQRGYLRNSQLEVFSSKFRTGSRRGLFLQEMNLLSLGSFNPWDLWLRRRSWRGNLGLKQAEEKGCHGDNDCLISVLRGGYGVGASFRKGLVYILAETDFGVGAPLQEGWRIGGGGTIGIILEVSPIRAQFEVSQIRYPLGDSAAHETEKLSIAWAISNNLEIRSVLRRTRPHNEVSLGAYLNF